jgi:hypothetical protein
VNVNDERIRPFGFLFVGAYAIHRQAEIEKLIRVGTVSDPSVSRRSGETEDGIGHREEDSTALWHD